MKEPQVFITEDGSPTLYSEVTGEHYHSTHGAINESMHIFIKEGLEYYLNSLGPGCFFCSPAPIRIFEIGFGTGLNALLTLLKAEELKQRIYYYSVEKYPISLKCANQLDYHLDGKDPYYVREQFEALHRAEWDEPVALTPYFTVHKILGDIEKIKFPDKVDVFYMDAFSPEAQGNLWEQEIFDQMAKHANTGAVLTTYCSKGIVRRRLETAGFRVERIPGPTGKRHITRATFVGQCQAND
ncbi:tRNA (5-methylaminomethyl-2-thiouridine)(34)-methyltransferase MnmD [Falsiporphyromonas endometrii]|uniref:tRNA (5-methylaminomethyl-2-thiouridine)(34)-methyltransferase MnmD n=1 Tax=Falsiporphyromonas endometrii TaxID=1387297 RepID=A0ABV9K7I5_9PORP